MKKLELDLTESPREHRAKVAIETADGAQARFSTERVVRETLRILEAIGRDGLLTVTIPDAVERTRHDGAVLLLQLAELRLREALCECRGTAEQEA